MDKDWKAYCTCIGPKQMEEYNCKNNDHIQYINIYEELPLPNINNICHHYSQIISMYYVWKNQLKSDYVCIWDHRRYFTPIDFDKLDKDGIQVYFFAGSEMTPFEYMVHEGINEYIIYQFIKYMIEKRGIDHDLIIDRIFNKSWENLWLITGFNCNWKVFNDICNFTFDFVDYMIPNGDHTSYDSIETFIQDMKKCVYHFRNISKDGEIIECGRIESEDRDIGNITECIYPLYCEFMGYEPFCNVDDKIIAIKVLEYNKDTIFDDVCKCVHKNVFTGCRNYKVITDTNNIKELREILMPNWYTIFHAPIEIISEEHYNERKSHWNSYKVIELNEYVDVNSPTNSLETGVIKTFK